MSGVVVSHGYITIDIVRALQDILVHAVVTIALVILNQLFLLLFRYPRVNERDGIIPIDPPSLFKRFY